MARGLSENPSLANRGSRLAVLSLAAFAVPAGLPTGSWLPVSVPAGAEELVDIVELDGLSPELRDKLLELLAAVREGKMTPVEAMAALRELTDFAKVDAAMKEQIAQLLDDALTSRDQFEKINPNLADAQTMSADVEWARENMASRVASEEAQKAEDAARGGESEPSDSKEPGPTTEQSAEGEAGEASEGQPGAKVPAKPSESADGAAVMMLGNPELRGRRAGVGVRRQARQRQIRHEPGERDRGLVETGDGRGDRQHRPLGSRQGRSPPEDPAELVVVDLYAERQPRIVRPRENRGGSSRAGSPQAGRRAVLRPSGHP